MGPAIQSNKVTDQSAMNLKSVQIIFFSIAILFTVGNVWDRFFTKKVTHCWD